MVQGTEDMVPVVTITAKCDYWHSEFLLKIGNGKTYTGDYMQLPKS